MDLKTKLNPSLEYDPVADGCQMLGQESEEPMEGVSVPSSCQSAEEAQRPAEQIVQNALLKQQEGLREMRAQEQQQQLIVINQPQPIASVSIQPTTIVANRYIAPQAPVATLVVSQRTLAVAPAPGCVIASGNDASPFVPKHLTTSNRTYSRAQNKRGGVPQAKGANNLGQMIKSAAVPVNDVVESVVSMQLAKQAPAQQNS